MKRVLVLAYYFPPMGGSGVQRPVKFVKYLEDFRYRPEVVALDSSVLNGQVPKDGEMMNDIAGKNVHYVTLNRTEKFQSKLAACKLTQYTPKLHWSWWVKSADRLCSEICSNNKPDVIFATVSPFSTARVADSISRKYKIPWVLDIRDPWALDPISYYPSRLHYKIQIKAMKNACQSADAVIMNTPRSLESVKAAFPDLPQAKMFYITNGWDSDDIAPSHHKAESKNNSKSLTIVHTGRFYTGYSIKVSPSSRNTLSAGRFKPQDLFRYSFAKSNLLARTAYYLFQAIRKLLDDSLISDNDIRLIFVGQASDEDKKLISIFNLQKMVEFKGYLNHSDSIEALNSADVLFLPLHEPEDRKPALIVPGKTYEYMAAALPILALVPPGDARDFVFKSGLGFVCDPTDIEQIAGTLMGLIQVKKNFKHIKVNPNQRFIRQFERKNLTHKLTEILDFAINNYSYKS